jgi:uroporphyrinogen-III synthase
MAKTVAILETRTGAHLAQLVERLGAQALLAPALEEVPDITPADAATLIEDWTARPFKIAIFQTGVGTRALFQAAEAAGLTEALLELLARTIVVVRGPKPSGELNSRGVRMDIRAPSPFTTETVLAATAGVALSQERALVQRYGEANRPLRAALEARGAEVHELATYRWALPADTKPLERLIEALAQARVDAVVFTSAVQVQHLFAIAERLAGTRDLARYLAGSIVASIGPVCSRALRERGIQPTFEADPPKLGPLVAGLKQALENPQGVER